MTKESLLQQEEFVFPELLGRILLYTVGGEINNKIGAEYVQSITGDYVERMTNNFKTETKWEVASQTLTLLFRKMCLIYNNAINNCNVRDFISSDPTNFVHMRWIDNTEKFIASIQQDIFEVNDFEEGKMYQMITSITKLLDEYSDYLAFNMFPSASNYDILVPKFREENMKWLIGFRETTDKYRIQINSLHNDIWYYSNLLGQAPPLSD